ncbi:MULTISPECIES: hypothetical protein [Pseudomonas]|uniref:hypothetical protein n=1 Tax=Pseudomonas TaxID=286 RepID=UPI0010BF8EB3|nr:MULTISPECIES: hypothetical protein [Pseudomonas]
MDAPSRRYLPHPYAKAAPSELKTIRRRVDIYAVLLTTAAVAFGIAGFQLSSMPGRLIGMSGMIACVFIATYLVDTAHGISNLLRSHKKLARHPEHASDSPGIDLAA